MIKNDSDGVFPENGKRPSEIKCGISCLQSAVRMQAAQEHIHADKGKGGND